MDIGHCAKCRRDIVLGMLVCYQCGDSFCSEECAGFHIGQEVRICNKCKEHNNRYYKNGKIAVLYSYDSTFATLSGINGEHMKRTKSDLIENLSFITNKELVELVIKYQDFHYNAETKEERKDFQKMWVEILQSKYGFDFKWCGEISISSMVIYWATPGKTFTIINIHNYDHHGYGECIVEDGITL